MRPEGEALGALTLVAASAGSGKTHYLTQVVTRALDPAAPDALSVSGLVAVTYTRKAAAELESRLRRTLVSRGAADEARRLPLARVGTVHSVCLRLLREHAIDAGLSPQLEVLPGQESPMLRAALESGLPRTLWNRLGHLAARLEVGWDSRVQRYDWLEPVRAIMTLARSNRIDAAALAPMAARASDRLRRLLGPPLPDADALERELGEALARAERGLEAVVNGQKNTEDALELLRRSQASLARGELAWSRWVALSKIEPGKAGRDAVRDVVRVAGAVDRHPRLHDEIHEYLSAAYEAAALGLGAYERWKGARHLVDFVDMIDRTLELLELPEVADELTRELELSVVDEFQDTSPLQLALFVRLHELTRRSVWVGDHKQCIFEYAGADPTLMEAVADWVRSTGQAAPSLQGNYRSRPELVGAASRLFTAAFARHGQTASDAMMTAQRPPTPELAALPPLGIWYLEASKQEDEARVLAAGLAQLLERPEDTVVLDPGTEEPRGVRPADIAVLVATNDEAARVAEALESVGVRVALPRTGLLDTPEGTLVEASLSYLADRTDTCARAVVDALTGLGDQDPDTWLAARIAAEDARRAAVDPGSSPELEPAPASVRSLDACRPELAVLAPSEVLDRVLSALDMAALCARWPDPEQRLANLDALRALAERHELRCRQRNEPPTLIGLLRYCAEARSPLLAASADRAVDAQHPSPGDRAVTVTTYHRAKGLQWPIVVLSSLGRKEQREVFSVLPATDRDRFDPTEPLGGRWIRYWPWPFGGQRKARLADVAAASVEGRAVSEREARERLRLLYVGFTRARDHLVLALRTTRRGPSRAWLDELRDAADQPLLELPAPDRMNERTTVYIRSTDGTSEPISARVWYPRVAQVASLERTTSRPRWFRTVPGLSPERPPYRIAPSKASSESPPLPASVVGPDHVTGARLPLGSDSPKDWSVVGDCLHAFLAADTPDLTLEQRHERARRLLSASDLLTLLDPREMVRSSQDFHRWVGGRWPGAIWHRELPVSGLIQTPHGSRRIEGVIDLLLEMSDGVVLIDHKSYPGRRSTWLEKAGEYAPQLATYAEALRMAGHSVLSQWISFPVAGGVVEVLASPETNHSQPLEACTDDQTR